MLIKPGLGTPSGFVPADNGAHMTKLTTASDAEPRIVPADRAQNRPLLLWLVLTLAFACTLLAPALWNGYPLLQYDTGGYLARWYEGYLVPSRSTTFGLYLHLGEGTHFWPNLIVQALLTIVIMQRTMQRVGVRGALGPAFIVLTVLLTTTLPFLTSMLLTDIFCGLGVLATILLALKGERPTRGEAALFILTVAFAASSHSATLGVLGGSCLTGLIAAPWLRAHLSVKGLAQAAAAIALGAAMLVAANFALSGKAQWTPGGASLFFGRMLQDGIVKKYLDAQCPYTPYKLCPYKDRLPRTADDFFWGKSVFNDLGRFAGMSDEMSAIVRGALIAYPREQLVSLLRATGEQLTMNASGEGVHHYVMHTYGIMHRFIPQEVAAMERARQFHEQVSFDTLNRIHAPVALISFLALGMIFIRALIRRRMDTGDVLVAAILLAVFGNALLCGGVSGPHDRYGARIGWLATFAVMAWGTHWWQTRRASS